MSRQIGSVKSLLDTFPQLGEFREVLNDRLPGWPVVPVMNWMARTGRHLSDTNDLTQQLAEQLVKSSAPIVRLRLSVRDADDDGQGWSAVWEVGKPLQRNRVATHGFTDRSAYLQSPLSIVDKTQAPYRIRLDGALLDGAHAILGELSEQGATDYMALPLRLSSLGLASVVVVTDRINGFTDEDIKKFAVLTSAVAPTFEAVELRHRSAQNN